MQCGKTPPEVGLDLRDRLHSRTPASADFARAGLAPGLDHFARHLDMALHGGMVAQCKYLVLAICVGQHALCACRHGKVFAVPRKRKARLRRMTEPGGAVERRQIRNGDCCDEWRIFAIRVNLEIYRT